ncbi:MAG: hypothetical protein H8D23_30155 [Candidatus Brocadiales bacterium]|nr:hypothetical protein [Candidatus Brocadiales bacterium]
MNKTFYEIFKEVHNAKKKAEKIAVLHHYSSGSMKTILGYTYNPNIKWLLPEGTPPYTPLPKGADQEAGLSSELRRIYLFVEGDTDAQKNLKPHRREQIFIDMLESIDPRDAKVLIGMKEGKQPFNGLTRKLVEEAFPNLAKDW